MNFLFTFLIVAAILTSIFTIGILVLWWKGVTVILLPGMGLMVSTPFIVLLLLIVEVLTVLGAIFTSSHRGNA